MNQNRLVWRHHSDREWMLLLIAFGVTVVGTRVYLEATGYPQIGSGELHFAHALWGGLLQFVALGIVLTIANRSAYALGAVLGGIGVGLFIDEVGKFMTRTNDYFFPFAAPIIYAALVLVALLYLWERRRRPLHGRAALYFAIEQLKNVADNDLDPQERAATAIALHNVIRAPESPEQAKFAESLLKLLADSPMIPMPQPSIIARALTALSALEERLIHRRLAKIVVTAFFLINGLGGVLLLLVLLLLASDRQTLAESAALFINQPFVESSIGVEWVFVHGFIAALTGILFLIVGIMFLAGHEYRAIRIARVALVIQLTIENLLAFYFSQFAMIGSTLFTLLVFLAVERYSARFVEPARVHDQS